MPIDPSATIPPDTPLSKLPNFDPKQVPVLGVDAHLPPVALQALGPEALRRRFAEPRPWEPEVWSEKRFTDRQLALASVLVPIVMRDRPTVLLTERTAHLSTHSGQVAFPGGKQDDTDVDAAHTALREAHEEIGLEREWAEVIGTMPTYTTGTMFVITPVVALVQPDYRLTLNPHEVADAFEVPLDFLMDPRHHRRHAFEFSGTRREWFSMPYEEGGKERFIWGATAAMLRNFYRFLSA
ncbi:CoA pyrophosphatase [Ramlibacter pallidus]|uniref:CoA pyrophosphatase n=1 Tax=Ramlibacter pallidus TaxID=2780087 RepID=A0ABR9S9I1_9BURK|nr:CoA pyrophosphatase [Ramlibacter pallidus]MBE7370064.1 CoA pyrophosphatase [Ramlibacter pallidus]